MGRRTWIRVIASVVFLLGLGFGGWLLWGPHSHHVSNEPTASESVSADGGPQGRRKPTLAELARLTQPPPPPVRMGSIAGRVTGPDAAHAIISAEGSNGRFRTQAADDGSFLLVSLTPGEYTLTAASGALSSEPLGPVPLGEGEQVRDLELALSEGGSLAGVVRDSISRRPIAQAVLVAGGAETVAGDDGAFVLRGLPPGDTLLRVHAKGYGEARSNVTVPRGKRQSGEEIWLTPQAHVSGRVQQSDGAPIVSVSVVAQRYGFGSIEAPDAFAETDADGHFDGFLEPGRFTLYATVPGGEARSDEFDLRPGDERRDLVLTADIGGQIVGQVLEADGTPVASASVTAVETVTNRAAAQGMTTPEGRFQFDGLPSGVYAVVARLDKRVAERGGLRLESGDVASAEITFGGVELGGRVVDGTGQPVIGAQVTAAAEGALNFAATSMDTDARGGFHFSGLSGSRFALEVNHVMGKAEAHGIAAGTKDVVLKLEGQSALQGYVVDDQGHAVTDFRVLADPVDANSLTGVGGARAVGRFASPNGDFHLTVQPGRYSVRVAAPGFATVEAGQVEAPRDGSSSDIKVVVHRTRTIVGDVVDAQNQRPLGGVRVATNPNLIFAFGQADSMHMGGSAISDANGHFAILDAEPGDVNLFAAASGYAGAAPVRVPGNQDPSVPVHLTLTPGDNGMHDFSGVGMQLTPDFRVASVFGGGPADLAGIRAGDQIVSVDGTPVTGHNMNEVINWIRGETGMPVAIGVIRNGVGLVLVPTRAAIKF
jgi:hypothetical protein